MKELDILLLVAIVAMAVLLMILVHKITILKKQIDEIVQEVKGYVDYVTAEDTDVTSGQAPVEAEEPHIKSAQPLEREAKQSSKEEMNNHIIQAVLGEYFL